MSVRDDIVVTLFSQPHHHPDKLFAFSTTVDREARNGCGLLLLMAGIVVLVYPVIVSLAVWQHRVAPSRVVPRPLAFALAAGIALATTGILVLATSRDGRGR